MILVAAGIVLLAFLISLITTFLLRDYFAKIGFTDRPGPRKIHFTPTPLGGGFGILAGFALPILAGFSVAHLFQDNASLFPEEVAKHFPGAVSMTGAAIPILLGAVAIFVVGLADDRFGLTPLQKLTGQILVAAALAATGMRVSLFIHSDVAGFFLTVAWTVALMNAFNFLDNANGLSAGVAAVVSVILFIVAVQTGQLFVAALLLAFLGALVGFLVFNFPNASIFMGDAGSLLIGFVMAVITILFTFYSPKFSNTHWPILLPVLVMAVPLFDTASVIFLRLRVGQPIYQGDNRHLSHRLMAMGMTETCAVATIWLLTFSTGVTAILLRSASAFGCVMILAQTLAVLGLVVIIEATVGGKR